MNGSPFILLCVSLVSLAASPARAGDPSNPGGNDTLGRCCFLGIVPTPILCEVTTELECFNFAAPVSWTPNADCDEGCANGTAGACCVPMNIPGAAYCIQATLAECLSVGGDYHGDGSICSNIEPCPPLGRCCFFGIVYPPYLCDVTTEESCGEYIGGTWTIGLTCDWPCENAYGACCIDIDDGPLQYDTCIVTNAEQCAAGGGAFAGAGTECHLAACCLPNGGCQDTDPRCCEASGGQPQNVPCDSSTACQTPTTGACCLTPNVPTTNHCVQVTSQQCGEIGGSYQGDGTLCSSAATCPPSGRCCFVGIAPSPTLCDVTTQAECMNYAGFVSWTAYLTCDSPCEPSGGDIFSACGTLGPGPQACILFHADNGETFALENAGPAPANRVWVRGVIEPFSYLCFPIVMPALVNNTLSVCFDQCGVLVQGVECILFSSDGGGLYVIEHIGGHAVGDHVRVRGGLNSACATLCMQGDGCIEDNTIEPCMNQPLGACCSPLLANPLGCIITTAANCLQIQGQFLGVGTECVPNNPCAEPSGRCCFLGFNPAQPLCEVTTLAQCYSHPAPLSWTPGMTCNTPCPTPCAPGDANGDGIVDGEDIPGFVRALCGAPMDGDRPDCCNFGAASMAEHVNEFVRRLIGG
ncbi:MAG: hypothetical protein KF841_15940 [Phycisphaerae bacterium]|nr:hypothetical protein [Phycisphaerae bacterium]